MTNVQDGPVEGSLAWHEAKLAKIPWWRPLAWYQQSVATELQRERCIAVVDDLRKRLE